VNAALLHLSPNASLLLFTLGIGLIYIELNRPGSILPGAVGLLLALLAVAPLLHQQLSSLAVLSVMLGVALLARGLRRTTHVSLVSFATLCLLFGFLHLIAGPLDQRIHATVALPCALILGVGTAYLTRIAHRARLNKGLD
jgi:membrane-bound serine protease (ClpP class)